MHISQSLIKTMFHKWNEIPDAQICYRKIYAQYQLGLRTKSSLANLYGLKFEDLCCDTNNNNVELPKHAKSGKKLTMELRIEQQAHIFKEWVREVNGAAWDQNSQITIYKRWEKDPKVILSGKLDIFPFPRINEDTGEYVMSILDIKWTGNITTTFGKFGWGDPDRLDHLQPVMYLYLVRNIDYKLNDELNPGNNLRELTAPMRNFLDGGGCKFIYYVADGKTNFTSQVIEYELKVDDFAQLHEVIRKSVRLLRMANDETWPANPSTDNCMGNPKEGIYECPFVNCSHRCKIRKI